MYDFPSTNSNDGSTPGDIVPHTWVNAQSPSVQEAGLQLLLASPQSYPITIDIFPFANNLHVPSSVHDDVVQYFHVNPQVGLAVPEAQRLSSPYVTYYGNRSAPSTHSISSRQRPLTILESHSYVYPCWWFDDHNCNHMLEADISQLSSHLKEHHGIQGGPRDSFDCLWQGCLMHVKYNSLPRHIITHLGAKIRCLNCSKRMARLDCARAHQKKNHVCSDATFQAIPGPGALYSV